MSAQQTLIDEYKAAYFAANGQPITVWYEGGWFRLQHDPRGYIQKLRRKQIEAFRDTLKMRVVEKRKAEAEA